MSAGVNEPEQTPEAPPPSLYERYLALRATIQFPVRYPADENKAERHKSFRWEPKKQKESKE